MGPDTSRPPGITQAEESLRALLNASTETVFLMDIDGTVIAANEVTARRLGVTIEELEGANAYDLIPPDIVESRKRRVEEAIESKALVRFEDTRTGRTLVHSIQPILGADGKITRVAIFATDVTEQKKTEAILLESEQHLRNLITHINTGVVVHAPDTSITLINPVAEELLGIKHLKSTGEKADSKLWKFISEDRKKLPTEMFPVNQVISQGKELKNYLMGAIPPDHGDIRWFLVNAYPIFENRSLKEIIVSFMEITERKRAEDEIKKLNQELMLYQFALNVAEEAIFISRRDATISYVNRSACEKLGYSKSELLRMSIPDIDPNYQKEHWDGHWDELRTHRSLRFESEHRRKDGTVFPIEVLANYLEYLGEEYDLVMARDITEQKSAAEALAYSQRFLRSIIDTEPECVKLIEPDGTLIDMNPSGLAMIDVDDIDQVRGQNVTGIVAPEHREEFAALTRRVCEGSTGTLLFRTIGLKGTERWLETHAVPFYDEKRKKTVLLGVTRDVTEKKRYEDELKKTIAEKEMLTRESYHRIKNNLAVIQSLLKLQYRDIEDKEAKEKFQESEDRVRSMSLIHEQLYRSEDMTRLNLSQYLKNLVSKLSVSYRDKKSRVRINLDIPDLDVDVDAIIPLGLIVNELVTNSFKYAFPQGTGEIRISIESAGDDITLKVRDNGIGVPEGLDVYNVSSLGMQIVTSLTRQLNGELKVERKDGTEVTLIIKKSRLKGE